MVSFLSAPELCIGTTSPPASGVHHVIQSKPIKASNSTDHRMVHHYTSTHWNGKKPLPGRLKNHFGLVAIKDGYEVFIHIYILSGIFWVPLEVQVPSFEQDGPTGKVPNPVYSVKTSSPFNENPSFQPHVLLHWISCHFWNKPRSSVPLDLCTNSSPCLEYISPSYASKILPMHLSRPTLNVSCSGSF